MSTFTPERPPLEVRFDRRTKCALILQNLKEPHMPPFLAIAAERAGVPRAVVRSWIAEGEQAPEDGVVTQAHLDMALFAAEVRRIRAEWCARALVQLTQIENSKTDAVGKRLILFLQLLDRETFLPAAPQKDPKDEKTFRADTTHADEVDAAARALGN